MTDQNNEKLIELIELLRRPMYSYTRGKHNPQKGAKKTVENALGEIDLLIYAYAKQRMPEIEAALGEVEQRQYIEHDWHQQDPSCNDVCRRCGLAHKNWAGEPCHG